MLSQLSVDSLNLGSKHQDQSHSEVSEYGPEILDWLYCIESRTLPNPDYILSQVEITWKMRKTLFLWLNQVAQEFKLVQDTLYLTYNLIDRIGSRVKIGQHQFQLLGLTCLWIAAKSEENHGRVPSLKKLMYMCCHTYNEREFLHMEKFVLIELGFYLGHVSPEQFLSIFCQLQNQKNLAVVGLARYFIELSVLHRRFLGVLPSLIARAALNLATAMVYKSDLLGGDELITLCMHHLVDCLRHQPDILQKKFCSSNFSFASKLVQQYDENTIEYTPSSTVSKSSHIQQGLLTPPKEVTATTISSKWNGKKSTVNNFGPFSFGLDSIQPLEPPSFGPSFYQEIEAAFNFSC
ncbi:cyclin-like protein [Globomyces pollinis-pini]|nr:cyclin-like protein [Globomyces pollinis-pini]